MCASVLIHLCVCVKTHLYVFIIIYVWKYKHSHTHTHTHTQTLTLNVCICVCLHTHMCVCVCVCVHMHAHTYGHIIDIYEITSSCLYLWYVCTVWRCVSGDVDHFLNSSNCSLLSHTISMVGSNVCACVCVCVCIWVCGRLSPLHCFEVNLLTLISYLYQNVLK